MSGETDLETLLRDLQPVLDPEIYVFATIGDDSDPDGIVPRMIFNEDEGPTLIVTQAEAEAGRLEASFPCRRITLQVHSSLEAVGLIARVATELSQAGISTNPVSGFFHDHLFVPEDRADDAMQVLKGIATG